MDATRLAVLDVEVQRQAELVAQIYDRLATRAIYLDAESDPVIHLVIAEGVAYQLHNLYGAVEDLMQIVAKAFENNVADLSRWHTQLLDRMTLTIPGVRPALFAAETAVLLHQLRGFRHFFRHAYGATVSVGRVRQILDITRQLQPLLPQDITRFRQALTQISDNNNL